MLYLCTTSTVYFDRRGDKEEANMLAVASCVKRIVRHPGSVEAFNPG